LATSPISGPDDVSYDLFIREAGSRFVWKNADHGVQLNGDRIAWRVGGRKTELPLSDITAIHLSTEVSSPTTTLGATVCRISFKNGVVLSVLSTNSRGFDDAGFAARYAAFVNDLHARLSAGARASIAFTAGRGGVRYGVGLLVTALLAAGVAVVVVLGPARGVMTGRGIIALILGVGFVVAMFRFLQMNAPHAYDPDRPLESAASGSITATIANAWRRFRQALTSGQAVALGAAGAIVAAIAVASIASRATVSMFEPGRAQHALEVIRQRAPTRLVVSNVEVTPEEMVVVEPDPGGSSAPTVWTASRHSLFGCTDWDDIDGPTKRYDTSVADDLMQKPYDVQPEDVGNLKGLAEAAMTRAKLGPDSRVESMKLSKLPDFAHPEPPRWTVSIGDGASRKAEIIADRHGQLYPATPEPSGPPRIVIKIAPPGPFSWFPGSGTWLRLINPDRSVRFDGTLNIGDSYSVPDVAGLVLQTGKPESLEVTVDGNPVRMPAAGYAGRLETVLDPQALLDRKATSN
jgi:hypothetical protein